MQTRPKNYNYDNQNDQSYFWQKFSGLEFVVVLVSILLLIGVTVFGAISQNAKNRDLQRSTDFTQTIIPALQGFYTNSSATESGRYFPVAQCSGDLNEVDFEYTMRINLTGQIKEIDNHPYISADKFPKDKSGIFSKNLSDRKNPYRCPEKLSLNTIQNNSPIYSDNYPSCNFSKTKNKFCYLYTTSPVGDTFQLGYFTESSNCYTLYRQFRSEKPTSVISCN
jgi:type II secretory pathway pseudopilin PulG